MVFQDDRGQLKQFRGYNQFGDDMIETMKVGWKEDFTKGFTVGIIAGVVIASVIWKL